MKTNIRFPEVLMARREHIIHQRCTYLSDHELQRAVVEGRFVFAWDGELDPTEQTPTFGILESVTMNNDGSRSYAITTEYGFEGIEYQNAVALREEWCPEVAFVDKFGCHHTHKWIGLVERKDGKVYAVVTDSGNAPSTDIDPSTLILLGDCKVGLPEREEATNV